MSFIGINRRYVGGFFHVYSLLTFYIKICYDRSIQGMVPRVGQKGLRVLFQGDEEKMDTSNSSVMAAGLRSGIASAVSTHRDVFLLEQQVINLACEETTARIAVLSGVVGDLKPQLVYLSVQDPLSIGRNGDRGIRIFNELFLGAGGIFYRIDARKIPMSMTIPEVFEFWCLEDVLIRLQNAIDERIQLMTRRKQQLEVRREGLASRIATLRAMTK